MKRIKVWLLLTVGSIPVITTASGQQQKELVGMQVLFKPEVVMTGGKPTVYYELQLTNRSNDSIVLQKLVILVSDGALIQSMGSEEIIRRYSKGVEQSTRAVLAPNTTGFIYVEAVVPNTAFRNLQHRLTFTTTNKSNAKAATATGAFIGHSQQTPVVVGAPLGNGAWAAVYDPAWTRGHRRVVYAVDGKERIPGRFAIDFILLDSLGRYAASVEDEIKNWYGYGVEVKTVADGVVAAVRDDFSESSTLSGHPKHPSEKATGNYVSIDIGNGYFAFYEHLKPGSIRVKAGQPVKKGDVIAALGFTGQTTGPHLHFHIANANSPLGAEGVPFAFEQFTLLGTYPDFSQFGKAPWTPALRTTINKERPAPNTVIRFGP
jgi:murein DD-endopeptidase